MMVLVPEVRWMFPGEQGADEIDGRYRRAAVVTVSTPLPALA